MRVDFYILETPDPAGRLQFACRLTEKAYGLDNRVYAHTDSAADAQQLDDLLWSFRQESFLPHVRGSAEECDTEGDLLINLGADCPNFARGFKRVAEIVGGDEASVQAGRARFRQYRDSGIEPVTHKIKG